MSRRLTDFWGRVHEARKIIDSATEDGSYATLSSRTDPHWELVHWKTAEAIAGRLPRVYQILLGPGGDRRIRNVRIAQRLIGRSGQTPRSAPRQETPATRPG